jgi:hypothetical protein
MWTVRTRRRTRNHSVTAPKTLTNMMIPIVRSAEFWMRVLFQEAQDLSRLNAQAESSLDRVTCNVHKDNIGHASNGRDLTEETEHANVQFAGCRGCRYLDCPPLPMFQKFCDPCNSIREAYYQWSLSVRRHRLFCHTRAANGPRWMDERVSRPLRCLEKNGTSALVLIEFLKDGSLLRVNVFNVID